MSGHRAPSMPPQISGFDYVQLLGSGGFADVFLYQQQLPRRRVAVKVMLKDAVADGVAAFTAEANLMAQLSTHPAIVSIYQADVADDGRPYLVMEYCSKPNLQARYRRQRLSVAEALRIGIQVAGAVETAHRAGILHRDIKPANILVTEYGRPALTDFGIAGTSAAASEATGVSIPWSPPESFADHVPSTPQGDVYALGATVYTILAARSPFERPGGKNGAADLIARIQHESLPVLGRADVPDSLYRVLATAMAKSPKDRYATALEFAWALQKVQVELAMSVTSVDVIDDTADEVEDDTPDDGRTRVRSIVSIDPGGDTGEPLSELPFSTSDATVLRDIDASGPTASAAPEVMATVARRVPAPAGPAPVSQGLAFTAPRADVESTQARPLAALEETPVAAARKPRKGLVIGAIVAIAAVAGGGFALSHKRGAEPEPPPSASVAPVDDVVVPRSVPALTDVAAVVESDVAVFTWTNPDPQDGDSYLWGVQVGGEARELTAVTEPTVSVPVTADNTCIEVILRRADGRASAESAVGCAP